MWWLLVAFIEPIFDGVVNVMDNTFVNKLSTPLAILFYTSMVKLLLVPLLFFFGLPYLPPLRPLLLLVLIGILEISYLFLYLRALQEDDTSVVASLFSLGKILIPIYAFFIVAERLFFRQYVGFIIIVLCAAILTLEGKRFAFNKSFLLMTLSALLTAPQVVLLKYVLTDVDWVTSTTWIFISSALVILIVLPLKGKEIVSFYPRFKKRVHWFSLRCLLGFTSIFTSIFVISLVPVTVARSVSATQPIFVLLYALLFGSYLPNIFKERTDWRSIAKKLPLFVLIIVSLTLVVV